MNVQGGRSFVTVKMTVDLAYNLQKQILYTLLVASYTWGVRANSK